MKKYFKINLALFHNAWVRDLQIPSVVITGWLFEILLITVTIVFFNVIFSNVKTLAGWNFYQVLFLYAFARTITDLHGGWTKRGIQSMAAEMVRLGQLDFYITKPVDSMFFVSISKPRIYIFVSAMFNVVVGIYALTAGNFELHFMNVIWFLILAILSMILYYDLQLITIIPVFWFIRLWALQSLVQRLGEFMRYPINIFSMPLKIALFVLFPILAVSYIPVSTLFAPNYKMILYLFCVTLIFSFITKAFWKLGLRKYGSASS